MISPSPIAPTNVSGRLFSRPTTAAPYAPATKNVSTIGSSGFVLGAMSTPARAASTQPRIQLYRAIDLAGAPFSAARSGLSTTARIAVPVRLRNSSARNAIVTTTATTR